MSKCESCKCEKEKLIKDRICDDCYKDAPSWVRDLVNDRRESGEKFSNT